MLKHHIYGESPANAYPIALLIKDRAMDKQEIYNHYLEPMKSQGIDPEDVVVFNLQYNDKNKAPVTVISQHLKLLYPALQQLSVKAVLVADAAYFKRMTGQTKTETAFGYPFALKENTDISCHLTVNYQQLIYQPNLKQKLNMSVNAFARYFVSQEQHFNKDPVHAFYKPTTSFEIRFMLDQLLAMPMLSCDIETTGLELDSKIKTIGFSWSKHSGVVFDMNTVWGALEQFFIDYKGTLIFHNAPFDTKILIYTLYMKRRHDDYEGMVKGLDIMYRDVIDTRVLAYLSTNTTAGNSLGLKEQAFEYAGDWGIFDKNQRISWSSLKRYNLIDCLSTFYLYEKYWPTIVKEHQEIWEQLFKPALKVITQMELTGMPIDRGEVYALNTKLTNDIEQLEKNIQSTSVVQHFNDAYRAEKAIIETAKLKKKIKYADDYAHEELNPGSHVQLRKLFYDYLDLPVLGKTDTGQPATDGKTVKKLIAHLMEKYAIQPEELQ